MKKKTGLFYAMMVVIGIFLVGCATGSSGISSSSSQGDLLSQAGFKTYTANSPEKLTYIQTLPYKKVVLNQYNNKPLYLVCTDPNSKQCFIGDKAAYERYQEMATKVCLAADQCQVQEHLLDLDGVAEDVERLAGARKGPRKDHGRSHGNHHGKGRLKPAPTGLFPSSFPW